LSCGLRNQRNKTLKATVIVEDEQALLLRYRTASDVEQRTIGMPALPVIRGQLPAISKLE